MLQMLNSGRTIKISEFAEEFETNPRNIIEYRKELDDLSTLLSVKMQYKETITKFVLSYGAECVVLEPEWLINDVTNLLEETNKKYKF